MTLNLEIQNANKALLTAIESICKLSPVAKLVVKKELSWEEELLAEQEEIQEQLAMGTAQVYKDMKEYRQIHGL